MDVKQAFMNLGDNLIAFFQYNAQNLRNFLKLGWKLKSAYASMLMGIVFMITSLVLFLI